MNKNIIHDSWDAIAPDDKANERMLSNILEHNRSVNGNNEKNAHKKNVSRPWLGWSVAAACMCLVIAGAVTFVLSQGNGLPLSEAIEDPGITETLSSKGLETADAEGMPVTYGEMPYVSPDEILEMLNNAETVLDCTVKDINRTVIKEEGTGNIWSVMTMTLAVNGTIRGNFSGDTVKTVSASVTNLPGVFVTDPILEGCDVNTRAAFVLRKAGEDDTWNIGNSTVSVRELGDYYVNECIGYDGECFHYNQYTISKDGQILSDQYLYGTETVEAGKNGQVTPEYQPEQEIPEPGIEEPAPDNGPQDSNLAVGGPFNNDSLMPGKQMISGTEDSIGNRNITVAENGKVLYSQALASVLAAYGDSANYRVYVVLFKDGVEVPAGSAESNEEANRLAKLGYMVALETVSREKEENGYTSVVRDYYFTIHATCDQVSKFNADSGYGYYLMLYDEYTGIPSFGEDISYNSDEAVSYNGGMQ